MNCTRRKADDAPFGHGFDTRRLHQIRTNNVIQWKSLEMAGLTVVFAFYGEIFSGIFQPLLYILGIYAHPLVRFLLGGVHFLVLGCTFWQKGFYRRNISKV